MTYWRSRTGSPAAGLLSLALLLWVISGAVAAGQRHYYNSSRTNCASASTTIVTILAGPLNYLGANPKISCHIPQPSR